MNRKKQEDLFPPLCCGACYHCHYEPEPVDRYYCWGNIVRVEEGTNNGVRKIPVIPEWPDCKDFKPRMNA